MATHIWSILTHKESLCVKWIHSYKLNGRSFWDVPRLRDVSWGWRELLQIHPLVRLFIWNKINNGKSTSIWFDKWHDLFPIRGMLTVRDITRSGFGLSDSVSDLLDRWPPD
ncbi:reverse transcriptase domain, reverse transcriptase zinc-binding domain protein, partial [Tanacetum coccineum]